ncbi:MAG: hypothetical protein ACTS8R_04720 [Arsenophonus sp. NC-QC1-MAG3]
MIHKTSNVLGVLYKGMKPKVKGKILDIWLAESCYAANKTFNAFNALLIKFLKNYYPPAIKKLEKNKEKLVAIL